jgi:hypothetical protein
LFSQFFHSLRHKKETQLITGLFVLNMLVKLVPVFRGIMIHPDAPVYLWSAQSLAAGDVQGAIAAYPMLFYPFLIMLVHKMGIDWLWAGRLISLTASSLALLPFLAIAKRFVTGWPLLVGALLFIFFPELNAQGYAALRDPLYLFLSLSCLYYALRFLDGGGLPSFWGAVAVALLLPLVRVEGAFTAVLVCGVCAWLLLRARIKNTRPLFLCLLVGLATLVAGLFFSETLRVLVRFEWFFVYFKKLSSGALSVQPCLHALDSVSSSLPAATNGSNFWQVIERHWPWIYFIGTLYVFVEIVGWPILLMGAAGMLTLLRRRDSGSMLLVVLFGGQLALMVLFYLFRGYLEVRYMLLPALLLLVFSLASLEPVFEAVYSKAGRLFAHKKKVALAVFAALLLLPFVDDSLSNKFRFHVPLLEESAHWVDKEVLGGDGDRQWLIFSNARRMAWFLERRDMRYLKKINEMTVKRYLAPKRRQPALFVLLLNRRVPQDMELLESLTTKYPETSKVFVDRHGNKHVVVAVWR